MSDVTVTGDKKLAENLKKLGSSFNDNIIYKIIEDSSEVIRKSASDNAPRRTGKLSRNIIKKRDRGINKLPIVKIGPSKSVFYGGFLERGTSTISARPFLRPAFDEHIDKVQEEIGKEAWEVIRRVL